MRKDEMAKLVEGLSDEEMRDLGIGLGLLRVRRGRQIGFAAEAFGDQDMLRDVDGWLWGTMVVLTSIELGRVDLISGLPHAVAQLVDHWWQDCAATKSWPAKAAAKGPAALVTWCIRVARTAPRDELLERVLEAADLYGVHRAVGIHCVPTSEQSPGQLAEWERALQ